MAGGASRGRSPSRELDPTEDELQLLELLARGATDEVAAAALGWNRRTLQRRLRRAMDKLGARSRFEAGYKVATSGWLNERGVGDREERPFTTGGGLRFGHPYAGP